MSTELVDTSRNYFQQYAEASSRSRIVGKFLKFSKGKYLAGQDGERIPEGTRLIANMDELVVGFQRWRDGKVTDSRMGRVAEGFIPPRREELGDTDQLLWDVDDLNQPRDPWQLTNMLLLKGVDSDELFTFTTGSKGGISEIGTLAGQYGKMMRQKPSEYPIISLDIRSYKHPNSRYGIIDTPRLPIVGWVDKRVFEGVLEAVEEDVPF